MAKPPPGVDHNQLTMAARRVLLDALEALADHRDAVVLVGAQAVYQHTGAGQLGVAAYTSDADLGLDPRKIGNQPLIERAMRSADFTQEHPQRSRNPGIWWKRQIVDGKELDIEVDLLVPTEMSKGGRRSVTMPPHDRGSMLRVSGIGLAMDDNQVRAITSLASDDPRVLEVRVAGVAALLIAKAYKLAERVNSPSPDRLINKDASDVIGLMLASDPAEIGGTLARFFEREGTAELTRRGVDHLDQLFRAPRSPGVGLAVEALDGIQNGDDIRRLAPAYVAALLVELPPN